MNAHDLTADVELQNRTLQLTDQYTTELGAYLDAKVPPVLGNGEYAARCSSLLIALTRQLGRCAAAFAEANRQDQDAVGIMVVDMFTNNHRRSIEALGTGESIN